MLTGSGLPGPVPGLGDVPPGLAVGDEPVGLQGPQRHVGGGVVELGDVDVAAAHPGLGEEPLGGGRREQLEQLAGDVDAHRLAVGAERLGGGQHVHRVIAQGPRHLGARDDVGAGAVVLQAQVEQPQRLADHARAAVVVPVHRPVPHHRVGVVVGVPPLGDGDRAERPGEVLVGEAVHDGVPARPQREELARRHQAVGPGERPVVLLGDHHGRARVRAGYPRLPVPCRRRARTGRPWTGTAPGRPPRSWPGRP